MLDRKGFDLWADGYDRTVGLSDEESSYPFAGYKDVLASIYQTVLEKERPVVLDVGFGTGTLTARLWKQGCEIYGQDFSDRMITLAGAKMPGAHLYRMDFSQGLAAPLLQQSYDFILATYSLHHLTDGQKPAFIRLLKSLLRPGGALLIGDVAFADRAALDACRLAAGNEWDDDEFYFVASELQAVFPEMQFEQVSFCAGILTLRQTPSDAWQKA